MILECIKVVFQEAKAACSSLLISCAFNTFAQSITNMSSVYNRKYALILSS